MATLAEMEAYRRELEEEKRRRGFPGFGGGRTRGAGATGEILPSGEVKITLGPKRKPAPKPRPKAPPKPTFEEMETYRRSLEQAEAEKPKQRWLPWGEGVGKAWRALQYLGVGQYAIAGAARKVALGWQDRAATNSDKWFYTGKWILEGGREGLKHATSFTDVLRLFEDYRDYAEKHPTYTGGMELALDILVDPGWLVGAGEVKAVAKAAGLANVASRVPGVARATNYLRDGKILSQMVKSSRRLFGRNMAEAERVAKTVSTRAKAAARAVAKETGETERILTRRYLDYARDYVDVRANAAKAAEDALDVRKRTPEVIGEAHRAADDAGKAFLRQAKADGLSELHIKGIARPIYDWERATAAKLVNARVLSAETAQFWAGYRGLWRGVIKHVSPEEWVSQMFTQQPVEALHLQRLLREGGRGRYALGRGIPGSYRFQRGIIEGEVAEMLGKLPLEERVMRQGAIYGSGEGRGWLFQRVARQYGKTLEEFEDLAIARKRSYELSAETRRWGALEQKPYLPARVLNKVLGESVNAKIARLGKLGRGYSNVIQFWKALHVPYNVPTVMRNAVSNVMLAHIVGKVPSWQMPRAIVRGLRHVLDGSPLYREARAADPGIGATFAGVEAFGRKRILAEPGSWGEKFGRAWQVIKKPAEYYGLAEESAKMGVYDYYRVVLKRPPREAADMAVRAIFDYGDVPNWVDWLRRSGLEPFITYPYKMTLAMSQAMAETPARFGAYMKTLRPYGGYERMVASEKQLEEERKVLPEYMRGTTIRLPGEKPRYFGYQYFVPFGPWLEPGFGILRGQVPTMPTPISSIAEALSGYKSWPRPSPIATAGAPQAQQLAERAEHAIGGWTPRWIHPGLTRILGAARKEPQLRYYGFPPTGAPGVMPTIAGEVLGIRIRDIDPEYERERRLREVESQQRDIDRYINSIWDKLAAGLITEDQANRQVDERIREWMRLQEKIEALY